MEIEEKINHFVKKTCLLDNIFGKWILTVLLTLYFYGTMNFYQLNKILARITPKVLTAKLKQLEETGLIGRNILLEQPLRVEYYLTKKGTEFTENLAKTFKLRPLLFGAQNQQKRS